jgi:hypothetical protein
MLICSFKWWQMILYAWLWLRFLMHVHTLIYIAKIFGAKKLCICKRSVYEPYWVVIVVGYTIIGLGLSAFDYRIIYIRRIALTPYHNPHPHTIGFGSSTSAWISKTRLHIRIIRIRIGSDQMRELSTPLPSDWDGTNDRMFVRDWDGTNDLRSELR